AGVYHTLAQPLYRLVELLRMLAEALAAERHAERQPFAGCRGQRREERPRILVILPALVPEDKRGLPGDGRLPGRLQPRKINAKWQHRTPGSDLLDSRQLLKIGEVLQECRQFAQQGSLMVARVEVHVICSQHGGEVDEDVMPVALALLPAHRAGAAVRR